MKQIYLLLAVAIFFVACSKENDGGTDPPPTPVALKANLSLSKAQLVYDGISFDSTVTVSWSTTLATNVALDKDSVATAGTKTVAVYSNKTFELKAWNNKETTQDSKSLTVSIDPQLALLCNGWFRMIRDQYQDTSTKKWHEWKIRDFDTDDLIRYSLNRRQYWDFGAKRDSLQKQYGYADTAFTLTGTQKNVLRMAHINWSIVSLNQEEMVLEGYIPGIYGSPAVYSRQTYTRIE
jgi:hypothetical protein